MSPEFLDADEQPGLMSLFLCLAEALQSGPVVEQTFGLAAAPVALLSRVSVATVGSSWPEPSCFGVLLSLEVSSPLVVEVKSAF